MKTAARIIARGLFLARMLTGAWASAEAGVLSGSCVTGELYVGSDFSRNWFYASVTPPSASCGLNGTGATVTVSNTAIEFCYMLAGYVTVDLNDSASQLTVVFNTRRPAQFLFSLSI